MPDSFDVVVVGARCTGAPLAMLLARSGLKVCLIDRSRFPSEVPSTHAIQPNGVAALGRFGLEGAIRATGAPPIGRAKIAIDGVTIDFTQGEGFLQDTGAPMFCIRRSTLDSVLIDAAVEAGADFREGTPAVGLARDRGRVTGVETRAGPIDASLVVGADGPHSGIARMAGAREYHATPPGRLFLWGYFEGVEVEPCIWLGKSGDTAMLAAPTDGDLFLVAIVPSQDERARHFSDPAGLKQGALLTEGLAVFDEVAQVVGGAQLVGPVRTMAKWHGYFREATGPGWVLAGDAGHFKDPTPGQGIADAFRQVERLAPAITDGLADGTLDKRLEEWARWRDRDAWEMYWFATDMGAAGPTSPLIREMIREVVEELGGAERFMQVMDHQLDPSKLFTPLRAASAALTLTRTRAESPRTVGRELRNVMGREVKRRRLRSRPRFEALERAGTDKAEQAPSLVS